MLRFARGVAQRAWTSRLDCVLIDAGLLSLGAIAAALWSDFPGLVALALVPLALAYRSLAIPALVEATRIEPKTGLYNVKHLQRRSARSSDARASSTGRWRFSWSTSTTCGTSTPPTAT